MANPPKRKGTAGETELKNELEQYIPGLVRTPPTFPYDLHRVGRGGLTYRFLATRPDRGRWLVTMDLNTLRELLNQALEDDDDVQIEVKRYAKFALHTIFESKFGGRG